MEQLQCAHVTPIFYALSANSGDATTIQGSRTAGNLRHAPSGCCSRKRSEPTTYLKTLRYLDSRKNQEAVGRSGRSITTRTGCRARCRRWRNFNTGPISSLVGKSHTTSSSRSASKNGHDGQQNLGSCELWPSSAAMPSRLRLGKRLRILVNSLRRRHLSGCLSLMPTCSVSLTRPP